jgi:hypothetical protein
MRKKKERRQTNGRWKDAVWYYADRRKVIKKKHEENDRIREEKKEGGRIRTLKRAHTSLCYILSKVHGYRQTHMYKTRDGYSFASLKKRKKEIK